MNKYIKNNYKNIIFFLIITIAFILRFYNLSHIPPGIHGDEGEFGIIEQKIIKGHYDNFFSFGDKGSLFGFSVISFWTQGLFLRIFGDNVFGLRASSAFAGTITIIIFFFLSKTFFKNLLIAFLTTLAFATSHWHIAYSRLAISNIWTPLFEIIIFYFFYKGVLEKKDNQTVKYFLLTGFFIGLSQYFHYTVKIIPLIITIWFFIYALGNKNNLKKVRKNILIITISSFIIFLPNAFFYILDLHQYTSRINTVSIFNHLPEYFQRYNTMSIVVVLFWQFINTLKVFNFGGDLGYYIYGYQGSLLAPIVGIFAVFGLLISLINITKFRYSFLLTWFFSIIILGGVTTIDAPSSTRIIGVLPVLFLFVGVVLEKILKIKTLYLKYIKILLITLFVLNSFWDYKIYFINYIHSDAGWAQREPATQIAYYIKSLGPDWKVYVLRENTWLYFHHGAIRFLNPYIEGDDIYNSKDAIPIKKLTSKNVVYIMPYNSPSLFLIRSFYPIGIKRNFYNTINRIPSFTSYEIKNNYLNDRSKLLNMH